MRPAQVSQAWAGGAPRWVMVALTVAGSVMLMAGVAAGAAAAVHLTLPGGAHAGASLAWGLAAAGMACGVLLVPAAGAGGRRRAPAPGRPSGAPEEWLAAMRPDGVGPDGAGPAGRPGQAPARGPGHERAGG